MYIVINRVVTFKNAKRYIKRPREKIKIEF